jgi:hypothetical protein
MENETDNLESLNQEGVAEPETAEVAEPETAGEDEVAKIKKDYESQKILAEKAERELKALKKAPLEKETPKNDFTPKDYLALAQANVPAEDFDEVSDWCSYKKITLAEGLKSAYIKSFLKEKAEERASAQATSTKPSGRTSSKQSDEALLEKLDKNELPEEDIEKAVRARIERMKNKGA